MSQIIPQTCVINTSGEIVNNPPVIILTVINFLSPTQVLDRGSERGTVREKEETAR